MKKQSKKSLSLMLTAMMLLSNMSYASNGISGHWASETMTRWQSQELIKGDEKGNLNPDKSITRAEFITIVNKVMSYNKTGDKIKNYKDLKQNDWYYSQIMTALEQGYIKGTSADTMSPNKDITRQEVMVIVNNIAGLNQSKFDLSVVKDQDKIATWAKNAATNMIANGYITGYQGNINPDKAMKRAEAITLLDAYKQNNRTISFQGQYSLGKANKVTVLTGDIQINESQIKELIINKNAQGKIELSNTKIDKITNNSKEIKIYLEGKEVQIQDGKIVEQQNQTNQDKQYKDGKYTGTAKGYKSDVEVEVEIKDGKIVKIDVKQQEDPLYWNVAKTVIDRILQKQTPQVDASTGATITSKAIMYAVEEALEKAQIKKQEIQGNKELKDGKYIGQATGYRGIMRVEVEIKDGKIIEITLLSHSDDAGYIDSAKNILEDIQRKQTADVTAISGATYSSDGIKNAVKDALEQAKGNTTEPGESEYAKKNLQAPGGGGGGSSVPPTQNMTFTNLNDGVYEGEAKGFNSSKNIKVKVTVQGGVITDISLIDHDETSGYFGDERARILAQRIIDKKSSDVDIISGATFSSRGFINAVVNAVKQVASSLNVSAENNGDLTTFDANGKSYIDGALNGSGSNPKILLSNAKIDNDLVIRNTMVEGEVTLNNVKVDGTLLIQGGGDNSVKLINSKINNIIVDKQRGDRVNVVIDADTIVRGKVSVKTPAQIKTAGETKIATLELSPALFSQSSDEKYKTKIDAKVQTLDIQSLNANIVIEATSKIDKLKIPSAFGQYEKNKPEYTNNNFKIEIKDTNSITSSENTNTTSRFLYGDYNVDQVNYPQVAPFIHPPFYNMRVRVVVDSDNKIIEVANNNTGIEGVGTGPAWSKKHQKYWNRMIAGNLFAKFVGKNLDQVKNMDMRTGGVDTVAGATANSIAVKEAVINAFEGRAGRGFLNDTQTLKAQQIENTLGTTTISFTNTLPADFDVRLHSVSHGIYNAKTKIQGANLSQGGTTLNIPSNLKAGHYYVNIVDANKKHRSPDFEGGLAEDGHYPYFIIKSNASLGYDSVAKKLTVSDEDLANVYENVQHIIIKDKSKIGSMVPGRNGATVPYTGVEIDTIGHHGTIGTAATEIFDENTGTIKPNAKIGRDKTAVFENGKNYEIEVKVLGYGIINFEYTANETNKILEGDANVDQGNYPLVDPFIHPPFFNARVRVEITPEGKIVSVQDNKTGEQGLAPGATKEFWNLKNKSYWDALVNAKFFDKFTGKTLDEVKQMKVNKGETDVVAGATANSKAVKQAVINAIEKREGKKFLNSNETLKVTSSPILLSTATQTTDVMLTNTLPSDFDLELSGVVAGIYNSATGTVDASLHNTGTSTSKRLTIPTNLKAGHYYINIIDESEKYRSPDFETRGGIHYPYFVIKNEATLSYDNVAKKISVSDGDLGNIFNNIHEINVKDKSKIGTTVPGRGGHMVNYSGINIEPVGHHGNVDENAKSFFNADGSINTAYKYKSKGKVVFEFESGKSYIIELEVWGFEEKLKFELSI